MTLTDYHAKYYAHELTQRRSSDSAEKLTAVVAGVQVDLSFREQFANLSQEQVFQTLKAQDRLDEGREELIASIEGKLMQRTTHAPLFTLHRSLS